MATFLVASGAALAATDPSVSAAIIAAIASIAIAVVSGLVSYRQAVRQSREDLKNRVQEAAAQGKQERETAQRQYELEAIKRFRENVGPAKGQIIEAVHDLGERL